MKTNNRTGFNIIFGLLICLILVFSCLITYDAIKSGGDRAIVEDARETSDYDNDGGLEKTSELKSEMEENASEEVLTVEEDQAEQEYESIRDFFMTKDPNWNDSEEYQTAILAYNESIGQNTINGLKEQRGGIGEARFTYAYIDEDSIPELLLGFGNSHTSGIYVLKYDADKHEIDWIGEFSSFGEVKYVDHGNRIISQYGSGGLYMKIVSKIDGDKASAVGAVTEDGDGGSYLNPDENSEVWMINPGMYYYAGYTLPEGADGSHKDSYSSLSEGTGPDAVKVDFPDETYVVNEDEYNRIYSELLGGEEKEEKVISVRYGGDLDRNEVAMEKIKLKM